MLCVSAAVLSHDDVIKWKHFPRNWPFVREIHRSPVNFPHKGLWRGALMFSLIYAWINDWVNNREAGDLRRQHGHYDVIVMDWHVKLQNDVNILTCLTHRVTYICVCKLTTIGWDNGLPPGRCQATIWTNAGILLIWQLGTNFREILIKIHIFSLKKMHLNMSSANVGLFVSASIMNNGLSPFRQQVIIWTNADLSPIGP